MLINRGIYKKDFDNQLTEWVGFGDLLTHNGVVYSLQKYDSLYGVDYIIKNFKEEKMEGLELRKGDYAVFLINIPTSHLEVASYEKAQEKKRVRVRRVHETVGV